MRAIASMRPLPAENPESLLELELPRPRPQGRDLLVEVRAVSVNPVDVKVRSSRTPPPGQPLVLGWDAAGTVVEAGDDATLFRVGDEVYFAGSIERAGANSEFCLVDERIVGKKPRSLNFADAAALPLTTLTAYEALFHRLKLERGGEQGESLLLIGAAGGVGSMAIQLAKAMTQLRVIATASRPESGAWVHELGADHVIDHRQALGPQLGALGVGAPRYVLCTADTDPYFDALTDVVAAQGSLCFIVPPHAPLPMSRAHSKSLTIAWELMFTRSSLRTPDLIEQHRVLTEVAALVEAGSVKTTLRRLFSPISAVNLRAAHTEVETGRSIGKLVVAGWSATAAEPTP